MKKTENRLCMAFGPGRVSSESIVFEKYIGVAILKVLAVNPTRSELERIYNTTIDKDPIYMSTSEDGVDKIRIDFIVQSDDSKHPEYKLLSKISYTLSNTHWKSSKGTTQVINKYGDTAWVTDEELESKTYDSSKFQRFTGPYKPAYKGEAALIGFLKSYLNIDDAYSYKEGRWVLKSGSSLETAEAILENIKAYFKGDVKEIKTLITPWMNTNKIKAFVGIRTTEENQVYQLIYPEVLKLSASDKAIMNIDSNIKKSKDANMYTDTEFSPKPLHKYIVGATSFNEVNKATEDTSFDMPY